MSIQVNIFNSGSVPTAIELANFISELNTYLDSIVTLNTEQIIEGAKTFWGSKMLKFKQKTSADKLGFTFYDNQGKEVGNFEYDNKNNFRLLALGNYYSATNQEIEGHVGFKVYNKSALSAYRLLCPLAGNAKNSIASLTDTYTNFYMPLVFTNGAVSVTADNGGKVDLSTLIGSGSGDVSGLATVATTGDYNDLLNLPTLFSGNYNDLTNKPTLFSGSYGDLTDKPALFSGDYADLTNKPAIPANLSDLSDDSTHRLVTDTEKATWNNKSDFSGSYNDLTNKPTIPTVPAISTNITSDATSDTKTASPKAVKDFVEGKGYLTQHQDISGKADATDLEALEDRVETLEQGGSGGDTTQYSYLKLIPDLDAYTEAPVGEIVKYKGQTNNKYTRGWDYELIETQETVTVPSGVFAVTVSNAPNSKFNKKFYQTNDTIKYIVPDTSHEYIHEGDGTLKIGDYVYKKSSCTTNSTLAVRSKIVNIYTNKWNEHICQLDNNTSFEINPNTTAFDTLIFESQDGLKIGLASSDVGNNLYSASGFVFFYSDSEYGRCTISCNTQESEISYNKTVKSWQPIIMPTASN